MPVFLGVVGAAAAIIVIVVVAVKNNKRNKKAFEELKNSKAYALAVKIKDTLEKKVQLRYPVGEPRMYWETNAYGIFDAITVNGPGYGYCINIIFSEYQKGALERELKRYREELNEGAKMGKYYHILSNDNIGILVYSNEDSKDMPESIKIAQTVIDVNGYGQSTHFYIT